MWELIAGAVLGALASLTITHTYYRRAARDFDAAMDRLRASLDRVERAAEYLVQLGEVTKQAATRGTPYDDDYPFK